MQIFVSDFLYFTCGNFTFKIKLPKIVISILLNYYHKMLLINTQEDLSQSMTFIFQIWTKQLLRWKSIKAIKTKSLSKPVNEKSNLKRVSAIFYQIFNFSSNDRPTKTMKIKKNVFYFIEKALFILKVFKFL